jgi:hypothetical protein
MSVMRARLTVTGVSRHMPSRGSTGHVGSEGHRVMVLVCGVF